MLRGQVAVDFPVMGRVEDQPYRVTHIGLEQGLSQGTITCAHKDSRGFLWFGTLEGINRYDGTRIVSYRPEPEDSTAIHGNKITGIVEDPHGNLWIGTEEGLNRYDYQTNRFQFFPGRKGDNQMVKSLSFPFYADSLEVWYYNESEGIVAYNARKNKKRVLSGEFRLRRHDLIYHSILRSPAGEIWIRPESGLIRLRPGDGKMTSFFSGLTGDPTGKLRVFNSHLFEERENRLWLGGEGVLFVFDPAGWRLDSLPIGPGVGSEVVHLAKDRNGILWVATANEGIFRYNPLNGSFTPLREQEPGNRQILGLLSVLLIDDQDILWVCSDHYGVFKAVPNFRPFERWRHYDHLPNSLSDNFVRSMCEDAGGRIWIGTQNGGISIFDPGQGTFQMIANGERSRLLPSNQVLKLVADEGGDIWVATRNGLAQFRQATGRIHPGPVAEVPRHSRRGIQDLALAAQGQLLYTSGYGLFRVDRRAWEVERLPVLRDSNLTVLHADTGGRLFVGHYYNGFTVLEPEGDGWAEAGHYLNGLHVSCFYRDARRQLLFVATSKGLLEFSDGEDGLRQTNHYTIADGLPSNYIYGILPDADTVLWLSTNRGICRLAGNAFKTYAPVDGLQDYEFNSRAYLASAKGDFYFGGVNGFNRFRPEDIREIPYPCPGVRLTACQVNGDERPGFLGRGDLPTLKLSHREDAVSFDFVAPEFFCDGNLRYSYRLLNSDLVWSEGNPDQRVRYFNLAPGNYVFEVKAMNCDGRWSEEITRLPIVVSQPWWNTWTAWGLYLGAFVLLGSVDSRRRRKARLQREEVRTQKKLNEWKSRLYANVTHEFRTPLTVILGLAARIQAEDVRRPIRRNAYRLLDLINQLLDLQRLEIRQVKLRQVQADVMAFVRYVAGPYGEVAAQSGLILHLETEPAVLMMDFDPDKLERILVNLLSNALKFTPAGGTVSLRVYQPDKSRVTFLVADTGTGIAPADRQRIFERFYQTEGGLHRGGTGIGLAIVKELVELMEGAVEMESEPGRGATFRVTLPVRQKETLGEVKSSGGLAEAAAAGIKPAPAPEAPPPPPDEELPVILVIEDNRDIILYIRSLLEPDYFVIEAHDGPAGLEQARAQVPDIIICDIMMPGLDGYSICRKIKEDWRTSHIPFILLTARADTESRLRGWEAGADAYLIKPFHEQELRIRLTRMLELRQYLQEYYQRMFDGAQPAFTPLERVQREDGFLQKVRRIVAENLSDSEFNVPRLSMLAGVSEAQLYRKMKALTDISPGKLIQQMRMDEACRLLRETSLPISQVAYDVGFNDPDYFSRNFRDQFGIPPTQFRERQGGQ